MISEIRKNETSVEIISNESILKEFDMQMLEKNKIDCFFKYRTDFEDDNVILTFETKGYLAVKDILKKKKDLFNIKAFIKSFREIIDVCKLYFLEIDNIILNPDYVFWDLRRNEIRVIYVNSYEKKIESQLKDLTEFLIENIDYSRQDEVLYVNEIYDLVIDELDLEKFYEFIGDNAINDALINDDALNNRLSKDSLGRKELFNIERSDSKESWNIKERNDGFDSITLNIKEFDLKYTSSFNMNSTITFGRASYCDFQIKSKYMSMKHGSLKLKANRLYIKDLNSSNGIIVNGEKIQENEDFEIRRGDIIEAGKLHFEIEY